MTWTKIKSKKLCVGCMRWFWPRSGRQKYCSNDCKYVINYHKLSEYHKKYRKDHGKYKGTFETKRFCPVCKRWFWPKAGNQITCTRECKQAWNAINRAPMVESPENRPETWYPQDPFLGSSFICMAQGAPGGLICPAL